MTNAKLSIWGSSNSVCRELECQSLVVELPVADQKNWEIEQGTKLANALNACSGQLTCSDSFSQLLQEMCSFGEVIHMYRGQ